MVSSGFQFRFVSVLSPDTPAQKKQRSAFGATVQLLTRELSGHKRGFNSYVSKMTEVNAFVQNNINNEYDFICSKILKGENLNPNEFNEAWSNVNLFRDKLNAIINVPGIEIEIVGLWIWVTGQTKFVKELLKEAGFFLASKKLAWYWRPESAAGGRGVLSLDEVRAKYGSTKVNGDNFKGFKQVAA